MSITTFRRLCKACEQIERNEGKNADRADAIMKDRAARRARELGVPFRFIWINMNWHRLVPYFRALMTKEGGCLSCGHDFVNERDIQIEHRHPPRPEVPGGDWAREHTRNLGFACQSCNGTKGAKPDAQWLDEQEIARVSNDRHRQGFISFSPPFGQLGLFET